MAKTPEAAEQAADKQEAPAKAADTQAVISLQDFCMRLSERERRVTLIGGFEATEIKAGNLHDTAGAYQARFTAFINRPA